MAESEDATATYRVVDSHDEKMDLLGRMLSLARPQVKIERSYMKHIEFMLLTMPTTWTVIDEPGIRPEFAELWANRYGEWDHMGGYTPAHNQLGMAFAWWALHERAHFSEITLADSPDIRAVMPHPPTGDIVHNPIAVRGDIGRCSPLALAETLGHVGGIDNIHDLWISVLDWRTHVVVEFQYSREAYFRYTRFAQYSPDLALKKTFSCENCGKWMLDQDSREKVLEHWKQHRVKPIR
jgi:hypothetical protein